MPICFEELRRSQVVSPAPNFLILLGDRYGWRPLPTEISADEFRNLEHAARHIGVSDDSLPPVDLLHRWYRRDENSLAPLYILRPRPQPEPSDPDDKETSAADAWQRVERGLRQIIDLAFPPQGFRERFGLPSPGCGVLPSRVRFQASATEQEIWAGALSIPKSERHVRAFFREITNRDDFAPADVKDYFDITEHHAFDDNAITAQRDLKAAIRRRLGNAAISAIPGTRLKRLNHQILVDASEEEIRKFCSDVQDKLRPIIEEQIHEYGKLKSKVSGDPRVDRRTLRKLEIERDEHLRFARERGPKATFVGRTDQLERIQAYVTNDSQWPLVIHGDSGCGKTALLARAFQEVPEKKRPILRLIGATPSSSRLPALLQSLCQELRGRHPIAGPLSSHVPALIQEFSNHLKAATSEQPAVVFLDALDQLSEADNVRNLDWIPSGPLPSHAKIVVSCVSGRVEGDPVGQPYAALHQRGLPPENLQHVDALSFNEAKTLFFGRWLRDSGRTFESSNPNTTNPNQEAQRRLIEVRLEKDAACRQPLYLKLLFEEVKLWRSYDEPAEPGDGVPELLEHLFRRLSLKANHGPLLVGRALGYIAAARRGLSETEVLEVLFTDREFRRSILRTSLANKHRMSRRPKRIPFAIWSRLRSDLDPYLTERMARGGNVLTFYHRQIAEWVTGRFVRDVDWTPHLRLADFFERQNRFLESFDKETERAEVPQPSQRRANLRKLDELPWQLAVGQAWERLRDLLADPDVLLDLWDFAAEDIRAYWARLERNSSFRVITTYPVGAYDPRWHPRIAWRIAQLLGDFGQFHGALRVIEPLCDHLRATGDTANLQAALCDLGVFAYDLGEFRLARRALREQEELCRELENWEGLQRGLGNRALVAKAEGNLSEALECHREEEQICRTLKNQGQLAICLGNQALIVLDDDPDEALRLFSEEEQICQVMGDRRGLSYCYGNQALAWKAKQQYDRAMELLQRQERISHELGNRHGLSLAIADRANLLAATNRHDEAMPLFRQNIAICRELGNPRDLAMALGNHALICLQKDCFSDALTSLREEEQLADQLEDLPRLQRCLERQLFAMDPPRVHDRDGGFFWRLWQWWSGAQSQGDLDEILRITVKFVSVSRTLGDLEGEAYALSNQANALLRRGDRREARQVAEQARNLARSLNLSQLAANCERILRSSR